MKTETVYTTLDGKRHNTLDDAKRHADAQYGNELSRVAHQLLRESDGKYGKLMEFLDANLDRFQKLRDLKNDAETWVDGDDNERKWSEGENNRRGRWEIVKANPFVRN